MFIKYKYTAPRAQGARTCRSEPPTAVPHTFVSSQLPPPKVVLSQQCSSTDLSASPFDHGFVVSQQIISITNLWSVKICLQNQLIVGQQLPSYH